MITVYGREECVQCHYTRKFLNDNNTPFIYVDVDTTIEGTRHDVSVPTDMGTQLPFVVTPHGRWSGYNRDKLKTLVVMYGGS